MQKFRKIMDVTSAGLAEDLAREKGVTVEASSVRKVLKNAGCKYLPRSKKLKYSKEEMKERVHFAKQFQNKSQAQIAAEIDLFMDGVVFSIPPADSTVGRSMKLLRAVPRDIHFRSQTTLSYRSGSVKDCTETKTNTVFD